MSKKQPTAFENIRLVGVHKEPTFALGESVSRGICTKCKSTDGYNFVINNGLCNSCIAERLDELEAENKRLRELLGKAWNVVDDLDTQCASDVATACWPAKLGYSEADVRRINKEIESFMENKP